VLSAEGWSSATIPEPFESAPTYTGYEHVHRYFVASLGSGMGGDCEIGGDRGGVVVRHDREEGTTSLLPESQGQNLAVTVLFVPRSLDSRWVKTSSSSSLLSLQLLEGP